MKNISFIFKAMVLAAAFILLAAAGAAAGEAGQKQFAEARLSVEQSMLTREAKQELLTKADRAVMLGIPPEDAAIIITRGLKQGVESSHIAGFLETAASAKERNLPARLILDRTEQGLSKGVPAERISAVVQRLSDKLAAARPMVENLVQAGLKPGRSGNQDDAVETVARALEKSIPEDSVMRTGALVKDRRGSMALFTRAIDTITTFVGSGMNVDQASHLVRTAVERGYSERDMEGMERYMAEELRKGRSMSEVAAGMGSRLERDGMRGGQDRSGSEPRGPGSGMGGSGSGMGGRR